MQKYYLMLFLGWSNALIAGAATWYVSPNGDDVAHTGTNGWADAYQTISNAVYNAAADDMVIVSNDVYYITSEININKTLFLTNWTGHPADTIIDGQRQTRVMYIDSTNGIIDGFSIVNGYTNAYGGGIYLKTGLVRHCIISNNMTSGYGGGGCWLGAGGNLSNCTLCWNMTTNVSGCGAGIYVDGSASGRIDNCVISNNIASNYNGSVSGGGLYITAPIEVQGCTIVNNAVSNYTKTSYGGGISIASSLGGCVVTNCTIGNNYSKKKGAGLYVGQNASIVNCSFINNLSDTVGAGICVGINLACTNVLLDRLLIVSNTAGTSGGGVSLNGGLNICMRNSLIMGNRSENGYAGGGIYLENITNGTVINCTIVSNVASGEGGGVMIASISTTNVFFYNCIIMSNRASGNGTNIYKGDGPTNIYYSCSTNTYPGGLISTSAEFNNLTAEPGFVDYANGNFRLGSSAPCINAGTHEAWMDTATDLLGRPRKYYGRVDMGCYEYFLDVKVNGIPIDRIRRINGVDKDRIFRISQ